MWFKEVQAFQLADDVAYTPEILAEQLQTFAFNPCLPSFPASHGWAAPIDKDNAPLVHAANGYMLFCMQSEEKILPASVIRQELDEKVKSIEQQDNRKVYRREKQSLKDEIIYTLLPRAFSKISRIYAYIDTRNKRLIVNTSNANKLEKFSGLLTKTLALNIRPIFETSLARQLSRWLLDNNTSRDFTVGESCVIKDPNKQTRVIRCQNQDLGATAIQSFLKDGCQIHQLAMHWHERISFNLTENFTLKSVRYSGELVDATGDSYIESPEQQFDANFVIMTETLKELLTALCDIFDKADMPEKTSKKELEAA